MKRLLLCFIILSVVLSNSIPVIAQSFSDIKGHWAEEEINKGASRGYISGYDDGSFMPDKNVTRAEFAKIITEAFGLNFVDPLDSYKEFKDIEFDENYRETWYYPYLKKSMHYIPRYRLPVQYPCMEPYLNTNGKFLPECEIVRAHVAEALSVIKTERDNIKIYFPDIYEVQNTILKRFNNDPEYSNLFVVHQGEVASNVARMFNYTWLASELGIMKGNENGYFDPYGYFTRAELVTAINRMIE